MAITNSVYEEIMRAYDARQLKNRRLERQRLQEAYRKLPRLKEIDAAIGASAVRRARLLLDGDSSAKEALHAELDTLRREKADLLASLGRPQGYFDSIYDCPDCRDTGYIGNEKCHCFRQAIIDRVYDQSNIREILKRENFKAFRFDYYSASQISPLTGLSSLETARKAVATCRHFISDFDHKPKNLLFYGDTGVGKTFLSNCVAAELLAQGRSVIYFTAFQMFDILSRDVFDRDSDAMEAHKNIFDCDLLIIDDLGTELSNSFTTSQFFLCINERILRGKSTIISTNLSMSQLLDTYSERTFSRITSNYEIVKLFGDDIRLKQRKN